jgi:hypothetical protein
MDTPENPLPPELQDAVTKCKDPVEKRNLIGARLAIAPVLDYLAEGGGPTPEEIQILYGRILLLEGKGG